MAKQISFDEQTRRALERGIADSKSKCFVDSPHGEKIWVRLKVNDTIARYCKGQNAESVTVASLSRP